MEERVREQRRHESSAPVAQLAGLAAQFRRRTRRDDLTCAQHHNLIAGCGRELEQVRRDDHGAAVVASLGDHLKRRVDAEWVDAVERLVEQQHRGLMQDGEHDREAAAHAVGEPRGDPIGGAHEIEEFEQLARALRPVRTEPAQLRRERKVLPRCRAGDQPADVRAVSDVRLGCRGVTRHVDAGDHDLAAGRRQHAGQDAQGGRLAGAVAAHESNG